MSKFKPGDKVTPVNAYCDNDVMEQFVGKTLLVLSVGNEVVCAGVPGEGDWYWHLDDLRLVSETQPEPAPAASKKPKPIQRGDLVEFCGNIWVVIDAHHTYGGCWIGAITGDPDTRCLNANELTRIGSIRKKIKRIKKEMENGK